MPAGDYGAAGQHARQLDRTGVLERPAPSVREGRREVCGQRLKLHLRKRLTGQVCDEGPFVNRASHAHPQAQTLTVRLAPQAPRQPQGQGEAPRAQCLGPAPLQFLGECIAQEARGAHDHGDVPGVEVKHCRVNTVESGLGVLVEDGQGVHPAPTISPRKRDLADGGATPQSTVLGRTSRDLHRGETGCQGQWQPPIVVEAKGGLPQVFVAHAGADHRGDQFLRTVGEVPGGALASQPTGFEPIEGVRTAIRRREEVVHVLEGVSARRHGLDLPEQQVVRRVHSAGHGRTPRARGVGQLLTGQDAQAEQGHQLFQLGLCGDGVRGGIERVTPRCCLGQSGRGSARSRRGRNAQCRLTSGRASERAPRHREKTCVAATWTPPGA